MRARDWLIPVALLTLVPAVRAGTAAAVLMVEDEGFGPRQPLTERLGMQLYGELLEAGTYAEVERIKGRHDANARLAAAIVRLAAKHDHIDVWLSVHTTRRDPLEMQRLIPPRARKLRLVYSTACHGDENERKAWEVLRPRAVVTHLGINNPLLALPYILSRWIAGDPIGPSVSMGWRETQLGMRLAVSLPGGGTCGIPDPSGSRPVVSGDRMLTIRSGQAPVCIAVPEALRWSERRGGSPGLMLRALARAGFEVHGHEVRSLADQLMCPLVLPAQVLERMSTIKVTNPGVGRIEVDLGAKRGDDTLVPMNGVTLALSPLVKLWPGKLDVESRVLDVHVRGVWARKGILRARINKLTLSPAKNGQGYRVRAGVGVFGFIPWSMSYDVGGEAPPPFSYLPPVFRGIDPSLPAVEGAATVLANTLR